MSLPEPVAWGKGGDEYIDPQYIEADGYTKPITAAIVKLRNNPEQWGDPTIEDMKRMFPSEHLKPGDLPLWMEHDSRWQIGYVSRLDKRPKAGMLYGDIRLDASNRKARFAHNQAIVQKNMTSVSLTHSKVLNRALELSLVVAPRRDYACIVRANESSGPQQYVSIFGSASGVPTDSAGAQAESPHIIEAFTLPALIAATSMSAAGAQPLGAQTSPPAAPGPAAPAAANSLPTAPAGAGLSNPALSMDHFKAAMADAVNEAHAKQNTANVAAAAALAAALQSTSGAGAGSKRKAPQDQTPPPIDQNKALPLPPAPLPQPQNTPPPPPKPAGESSDERASKLPRNQFDQSTIDAMNRKIQQLEEANKSLVANTRSEAQLLEQARAAVRTELAEQGWSKTKADLNAQFAAKKAAMPHHAAKIAEAEKLYQQSLPAYDAMQDSEVTRNARDAFYGIHRASLNHFSMPEPNVPQPMRDDQREGGGGGYTRDQLDKLMRPPRGGGGFDPAPASAAASTAAPTHTALNPGGGFVPAMATINIAGTSLSLSVPDVQLQFSNHNKPFTAMGEKESANFFAHLIMNQPEEIMDFGVVHSQSGTAKIAGEHIARKFGNRFGVDFGLNSGYNPFESN